MALRCAQCGNQTRFEVRRQAVLRFAAYPDPQRGGELREEKLPLGWELQGDRAYVCRACGSDQVADQGS
jgi:DNA-directed RNA polymerase subunit RPC12/RpoP